MNNNVTRRKLLLKRFSQLYRALGLIIVYVVLMLGVEKCGLQEPLINDSTLEYHGYIVILMTINAIACVGRLHKCINENQQPTGSRIKTSASATYPI